MSIMVFFIPSLPRNESGLSCQSLSDTMNASGNMKGSDDGHCLRRTKKLSPQACEVSRFLQIGSGIRIRGFTRDLSQEGAMME